VDVVADFAKTDGGQAVPPWTISTLAPGRLLLTFAGKVETGNVRALATALFVHLDEGPIEVVSDLRR